MKASDYIVEWLIEQDVRDIFGYPGGMVAHLMDSLYKRRDKIDSHLLQHEQAAAFAACGYAQACGKPGIVYTSSGPGATNLLTGICNAHFDSIPLICLTGQVNTFESSEMMEVRQRGFQETDIVSMVEGVTKLAVRIQGASELPEVLDKAFSLACSGRPGPVLVDIPMDVMRADIMEAPHVVKAEPPEVSERMLAACSETLIRELEKAKCPVLLLGNGVRSALAVDEAARIVELGILPTITSMLGVDLAPWSEMYFGFIGAYGDRAANYLAAKSDLVIAVGSRLDIRQVGANRERFAPQAALLRFDQDESELSYKVHEDEISFCMDARSALEQIGKALTDLSHDYSPWVSTCREIEDKLDGVDQRRENDVVEMIGALIPDDALITADVGQNQIWIAQSLIKGTHRRALFSGGLGAMGYSLPAAIGASIALGGAPVFSFSGDGGFQMNIQELQTVVRESLPLKMFVLNNEALGMIRHFQEMYFSNVFTQTKDDGYSAPDFSAIAQGYGIGTETVMEGASASVAAIDSNAPYLFNVLILGNTYVTPKLEFGKPNQDQEPLVDRALYDYLMDL